jgi:hypothetical protein
MATPKKKTTSRAEAGLVEEDFEQKPNDEALADGSWLDKGEDDDGESVFTETVPSETRISGMSQEEQTMNMTPVVVGPPAYGSPIPETSAGRLLPLDEHPFNPEALPEDHPVRIDENYGKGYEGEISASQIGTSFPATSERTDLERDLAGQGEEEEPVDYATQTKADLLAEAQARNLDVTNDNTKAEIVSTLEEDDATA